MPIHKVFTLSDSNFMQLELRGCWLPRKRKQNSRKQFSGQNSFFLHSVCLFHRRWRGVKWHSAVHAHFCCLVRRYITFRQNTDSPKYHNRLRSHLWFLRHSLSVKQTTKLEELQFRNYTDKQRKGSNFHSNFLVNPKVHFDPNFTFGETNNKRKILENCPQHTNEVLDQRVSPSKILSNEIYSSKGLFGWMQLQEQSS